MYVTIKQLATDLNCSERTIMRNYLEMERTGLYPEAVIQIGGVKIKRDDFMAFLARKRRLKEEGWKKN